MVAWAEKPLVPVLSLISALKRVPACKSTFQVREVAEVEANCLMGLAPWAVIRQRQSAGRILSRFGQKHTRDEREVVGRGASGPGELEGFAFNDVGPLKRQVSSEDEK